MRQLRRLVRQNVADDERLQLAKQLRADAVLRHVFAEDDQRLDRALGDAFGDLRQIDSDLAEANAREPRAVRVRILVRADQQLVRLRRCAGRNR